MEITLKDVMVALRPSALWLIPRQHKGDTLWYETSGLSDLVIFCDYIASFLEKNYSLHL